MGYVEFILMCCSLTFMLSGCAIIIWGTYWLFRQFNDKVESHFGEDSTISLFSYIISTLLTLSTIMYIILSLLIEIG